MIIQKLSDGTSRVKDAVDEKFIITSSQKVKRDISSIIKNIPSENQFFSLKQNLRSLSSLLDSFMVSFSHADYRNAINTLRNFSDELNDGFSILKKLKSKGLSVSPSIESSMRNMDSFVKKNMWNPLKSNGIHDAEPAKLKTANSILKSINEAHLKITRGGGVGSKAAQKLVDARKILEKERDSYL